MLLAKRGRAGAGHRGLLRCESGLSSPIDGTRLRISGGEDEGLLGLAAGGPGVAAAGVFGQRGIGEVRYADVEVDRERAGWETVKRGRGGTGWVGGQILAGRPVQAGPGRVLALPSGRPLWLHPEPGHLVWLQRGRGPNAPVRVSMHPGKASAWARPIQSRAPSVVLSGC
jgi:hypothetical protein